MASARFDIQIDTRSPPAESLAREIGGDAIDPIAQLLPRQHAPAVLQGDRFGPLLRMAGQQSVERVRPPQTLLVVAPGLGGMMQREERAHASPA